MTDNIATPAPSQVARITRNAMSAASSLPALSRQVDRFRRMPPVNLHSRLACFNTVLPAVVEEQLTVLQADREYSRDNGGSLYFVADLIPVCDGDFLCCLVERPSARTPKGTIVAPMGAHRYLSTHVRRRDPGLDLLQVAPQVGVSGRYDLRSYRVHMVGDIRRLPRPPGHRGDAESASAGPPRSY